MKLMGFYIGGHDSNVVLADSDGLVKYYKLERMVQLKHKRGNLDWIRQICADNNFEPDCLCFSDGNRNGIGICDEGTLWQETQPLDLFPNAKTYCIDHHYAHILSAFALVNKDVDYGVCVDGRGDHQVKCSVIKKPFDIYSCKSIYSSKQDAYCLMFNEIGKLMGLSGGELDYAGKIMGAHAYGTVDESYIKELEFVANQKGVAETLKVLFRNRGVDSICNSMDQVLFDWIASYHKWMENRIYDLFNAFTEKSATTVYAGGCAQNTVFNNRLWNDFDIIVPPHCYDGGLSLGCIELLAVINNVNLELEGFPFCLNDEDLGYASEKTVRKIVELLEEGKIVGWCQGKSEIGPRALGHRSIIMNPFIKDAKDILNTRVKKREKWRPFAASILCEDCEEICGKQMDLRYMLRAVDVSPKYREELAGVVHVDGSCRFQTVENNKELHSFYTLIKEFKRISGVPGLINTSYNVAGKPIASSKNDIIESFSKMDLDALCIGDELMVKE